MQTITIGEALKMARAHHAAGRLAEAEAVCRKLLSRKADQPDALHLLGYLVAARNREEGVAMIRRAIQIKPNNADFHNNLGCVYYGGKRYADAILAFRRAVAIRPDYADAYRNLGMALLDNGQKAEAVSAFRVALKFQAKSPAIHEVLIKTCKSMGRNDDALTASRAALQTCPDLHEALNTVGVSHFEKGEYAEAIVHMRRAVTQARESAPAHMNLAIALRRNGDHAEALAISRRCVELDPMGFDPWLTLGNCLRSNRRYEEAESAYKKVMELKPDYCEAFTNMGAVLRDLCRFDEARQTLRRAIALKVDSADAHWNYALALLLDGEYTRGFVEYEWRWLRENFTRINLREPGQQWFGSDPAGKTILVYTEQGHGDMIQMARFIPLMARRGARVILKCPPETQRLLSKLEGVAEVPSKPEKIPPVDFQIPAMSLPLAFETTLSNIPQNIPYLRADPALVAKWTARMKADPDQLRIGLVWAGQPKHDDDRRRSLALAGLAPLARISHARFFSLQKGPAARQLAHRPPELDLIDLGPALKDFADTAGAIENLDLVITVDTAVAHLAGAMGKTCWVLLASVNDWRWLRHREDSPWYPSLRLFRQTPGETWDPVIARVAEKLLEFPNG